MSDILQGAGAGAGIGATVGTVFPGIGTAVGGLAGGLIGGGISAFGDLFNWLSQNDQNALNRSREDNAIQRRVHDLQMAGLSPVLAAGSPAASANMMAPHVQGNAGMDAMQGMAIAQSLKQTSANIAQTQAQTDLIRQQKDITASNKAYFDQFGLPTTASVDGWLKLATILEKVVNGAQALKQQAGSPSTYGNYPNGSLGDMLFGNHPQEEVTTPRQKPSKVSPHAKSSRPNWTDS